MRILVISDSHRNDLSTINFQRYDVVIHCGDYGQSQDILLKHHVLFVKGNCDTYGKEKQSLTVFNKKILVTHGNHEQVKFGYQRLVYRALEEQAEICFFGHTHEQTCFVESGILFLNPGNYPQSYIEIEDQNIVFYKNGKMLIQDYKW
jgi:phosphoesterase, MJ0936 family